MTTVLNLGGGPGCGKSTMAALLYATMKMRGFSVELVREYIKSWAYEGRPIRKDDEIYVFSKQLRLESPLYGRVDWIVSDRPLWLSSVYERYFETGCRVEPLVDQVVKEQSDGGTHHVDFLVKRRMPYVQDGRYQTEKQALKVDSICRLVRPNLIEINRMQDILDVVETLRTDK